MKGNFQSLSKGESLAQDEFRTRNKTTEHLGQVKMHLWRLSGEISVFYYEDPEVQPGLPILPLFKT
jgi:hypothetical protein